MYTTIENPEEFAEQHLEFCKSLELKGRILVATEGINGTCSGTVEQTEKYMEVMKMIHVLLESFLKLMRRMSMHLRKCTYVLAQS